jgi:NADP-dependent 3-hydroxy acid dehydrogenase YdfG
MPTASARPKPQVVVITGASAGIGRAVARRYARDGARIGLLARGRDGLEAAKREVEELGGRAHIVVVDVADAPAVEKAAAEVEARFGAIDLWINNAMVSVFSPVRLMRAEEYRRVTEVNYLGAVHGTLAALRRMLPRNHGTIVQVGSALAYRGIPLQSAYCATKHAIQGFCDSLRCELLHDGTKVALTMVQLPGVNTTQFGWVKSRLPREPKPIGAVYQPEVIADAIHWAARHPKRERLVCWPAVKAVVGNRLMPAYADRVLARIGFEGQQTDRPTRPDRRDNLWRPLPGDHGARGPFDAQARDGSVEWWVERHRLALALGATALGAATIGATAWWRSQRAASRPRPTRTTARR